MRPGGSPAPRDALLRATLNKTDQHVSTAHSSLYADTARFYDSVDLALLIERGLPLGFSPTAVASEVEAVVAPRCPKRADWVGAAH